MEISENKETRLNFRIPHSFRNFSCESQFAQKISHVLLFRIPHGSKWPSNSCVSMAEYGNDNSNVRWKKKAKWSWLRRASGWLLFDNAGVCDLAVIIRDLTANFLTAGSEKITSRSRENPPTAHLGWNYRFATPYNIISTQHFISRKKYGLLIFRETSNYWKRKFERFLIENNFPRW